jgi:hypothetical protein
MALRERNVIGTVVDGKGAAVANATIKFKLTTPFAYTITHIVVDREFTVVTDDSGAFAVSLWCDEDSLVAVNYAVYFPIVAGGLPSDVHIGTFSLAYGDGTTANLPELIFGGNTAPTPEELLYTFIETKVDEAVAVPNAVYEMPGQYPSCSFPAGYTNSSANGNNDLYTVPVGRKAVIQDFIVTNVSGGSINYFPQIKIGGTYYRIGAGATEANLGYGHNYGMNASKLSQPIVLNAGEKFSVNTSAAGLSIWCNIIEFADYCPLSRADIRSWSAGNNTLLTIPVGRTIHLGGLGFTTGNNPGTNVQSLVYFNNSGVTRTINSINIVPSGGGVSSANTFATTNVIAAAGGFAKFFPGCLNPGDSIVFNVDAGTAGQFAWCSYFAV